MRFSFSRAGQTWRRNNDGAVAVEFALVGLPFFMMIIGLLEIALMYASATALEGGTVNAARLIRTGQAQHSADAMTTFKNALCDQVGALIPCSQIVFEAIVPAGNSFAGANGIPPKYDANGNMVSQGFDPGTVNSVVVVRASYRYKFITPMLAPLLANNSDHSTILMSTVTLRNEPYDFVD